MVIDKGDNVLIAGFIVSGTGQKRICVRAIGPSLPVSGALSDPTLELHNATGTIIAQNDNWRTAQQDALIAAHLNPADDRESALIATVPSGSVSSKSTIWTAPIRLRVWRTFRRAAMCLLTTTS